MKLSYNGFEFSDFGELSVSQSRELEGAADQPQRAKVTLRVRVDVFQRSYEQNRQVFAQAKAALALPNAVLVWNNDSTGTDYVHQTAVPVTDELPEEWGEYHQSFGLTFSYYEQAPGGAPNNVPLTFTKTGGSPLKFDVVNKWSHGASVERFSPLRSQRKETHAKIHVEGQWFGDTAQPLAARRTALAAQAVAFNAGMNGADGVLTFGDSGSVFQGAVRIEDWTCDVDQMVNAISFSFTATYTLFPDEGNYATAEFTVDEKDDFSGQLVLTVAGKISAQDEAAARTKLAALLDQTLTARDYKTGGQQLECDTTAANVSANTDGDTFTELTFNATYRKWKATNQKATITGTDQPLPLGNVRRWRDQVTTERFNPLRSHRERTTATLDAGGTLAGDMVVDVATRRKQLLRLQRQLKDAVNAAEVTLVYGDFSQVVRVVSFEAEINQAETGIDWALSATYTLFPLESSYATAEYAVDEKDDFTGQLTLSVSGRVQAQTEAAARTKLDALLAQVLADGTYNAGQKLGYETTANQVSANADGDTFTELAFSATYRKWKPTNQKASFRGATNTARAFGNVTRWRDAVTTERFDPLRKQRVRTTAGVEAAGTLNVDQTLSLTARRAALLGLQRQLKAEVNVAEGLLVYGDFSQTVRVASFAAEINQAETGIDWALSATYTLFPAESSYATAEYAADEKDDFSGQLLLSVSGRVQAQTEAAARTKLAAVLLAVTTGADYLTAGQQLACESTANTVDANADGVTFTELSFNASYRKWKATNQPMTFKGATNTAVGFGNVLRWRDHLTITRFNPLRKHRELTTETIEAAGTLAAGLTLSLAARRTKLLALQRALKAEVNVAEGTLVYGDFSQVVRVAEFTAEINQAETGIDWSLTASYTLFPDETNYATTSFAVEERDDFTGQLTLSVSGRVQAQSDGNARTKLAGVLAGIIGAGGLDYTKGQPLTYETAANTVSANADGDTFTELTFTATYRKWQATNLRATVLNVSGAAVPFGNVTRWRDQLSAQRFNPLRPHRERVTCGIEASGTLAADASLSVALRRAQLLVLQRNLKAAVNAAQCTLVYGDFSQAVRVGEFTAEINQAETGIEWSLAATYTLFPTEGNYATAEFTADERDDFSGLLALTVAGRIQSDTEAHARTKLDALLAAVIAQRAYAGSQQLAIETVPNTIDANDDGITFTELAFTASYRKWKTTNQKATFTRTGGGLPVPFGNVRSWRDHYAATRFNEQRSQRRHATGSVEASGTFSGDPALSLADRRTQLLAIQRQMKAEVNAADGLLVYGDWSQVVRVDDFQAEINSAETGIDWSLSASYSLFPNEGGYATAEFSCAQREDTEQGDEFFSFNGRISAPNGAAARAKLATLRTAVLKTYGWLLTQRVRDESNLSAVDANGDKSTGISEGIEAADTTQTTTALDLNFTEEYRRRITGSLVSSTLTRTDREEAATQSLVTTFSGSVSANGPTVGAAYATALARAQALGANRESTIDSSTQLRSSNIGQEQRQTRLDNDTELVRLTFSYEYVSKLQAGRAFIELTAVVNQDTFGVDAESCQGVIVARDAATASAIYASVVRSLYATRLVTGESTGTAKQSLQVGGGYTDQQVRFEFNLTAFSPKATGKVTWKYAIEVARDLLTLDVRTVLSGSCYAVNRYAADAAVAVLLATLKLGSNVRSRRVEDRQRTSTIGSSDLDVFLKLDFDEEYAGRVTGTTGVLEMSLTERVVYSGTRWAVQPLPFQPDGSGGVSIPQPAGIEPGSRTVSGSVTAGTLATAMAWAMKQLALLTGDANGNKFPQPQQIDTEYVFVARIDGIAKGTGENVKLHRVTFTFTEILPFYPPS